MGIRLNQNRRRCNGAQEFDQSWGDLMAGIASRSEALKRVG
jgi:hypothetical protein